MEAEDALKDLLLEIAHQETNMSASPTKQRTSWIGRARTSSRPVSARSEKEQQDDVEDAEDNVACEGDADIKDEDGIEDDSESFIHSGFGSRKVTMEGGVRLSTAFQRDWWRSLPDLAYVVTKVNQYGKRQTRTLRLTAEGIENVRRSGKVSSLYPYEAVLRVYMKNVKTFIIDYENAKHSYQYRSTVAMHIVQEITSRLALRKKEERLLTPDIATRLQEKLQQTGLLDSSRESRRRLPTFTESEEDRRSRQAKKLHNIFGSTEQQRLENAIDYIILDDHTPEGRTLKHFCSNFAVLEKNPATLVMNVRQFMDDMRAYILERRTTELTKLTGKTSVEPMEELSLSTVVEKSLERALVSRFRDRIVACLKKPTKEEEMHLKRQLAAASTKPQSFFGVAAEFESSSGWAHAVAEMQALDDWDLPSKLLGAILAAAKSIYATLNYEKNRGKRGEQRTPIFISTDDFFPIYLYVVAQANLKNPLLVSEYLWGLCDPEQLNGEGGYYLTVLCSTLEYLKGLDMETDEGERERAQREEEALRCLDVCPTTTTTSTSTTPTATTPTASTTPTAPLAPSPQQHAEMINSSTSVDSYFRSASKKPPAAAAAVAAAAALADEKRQRTISAPDKGASVAVAPSPSTCRLQRVVIGSSSRTAQEVVDEREKEKERLRAPLPEPRASLQRPRPADVVEPKKEQEEATAPPQAEASPEGKRKTKAAVVIVADEEEDEGGDGWGNQRARRRASKLDRRQVQQAIARFDVAQKED